jgi:surface protein
MFYKCTSFNQNLNSWNTSKFGDCTQMFLSASAYDQPMDGWNVTSVTTLSNFLSSTAFSKTNYDPLLISWGQQAVKNSISATMGTAHYSAGDPTTWHDHLTSVHLWTISDGGTP